MLDIKILKELQTIIKISVVCELAGLNKNTIRTKINNEIELTVTESKKLTVVIQSYMDKLK